MSCLRARGKIHLSNFGRASVEMSTGLDQADLATLKGIGVNVLILVGVTFSLIAVAMIIG